LSSPYFNFTDQYEDIILNSKAPTYIIVPAPESNGFYTARGLKRYIPSAYAKITNDFYDRVKLANATNRIKLNLFYDPAGTYHAKGIWIQGRDEEEYLVCAAGSSNFGWRAKERDVESQLVILSENTYVLSLFTQERQGLWECSVPFSEELSKYLGWHPPSWIKLFIPKIKRYL